VTHAHFSDSLYGLFMKASPLFPALIGFLVLVAAIPVFGQVVAVTSPRQTQLFDRNWKFFLGDAPGANQPDFDDSSWRRLDLPHDWSIEGPSNPDPAKRNGMDGPFDKNSPANKGGGYLNGGIGWYRKTFALPDSAKDQRHTLLFDGAYENSHVWINGHDLGVRPYGFVSFFYDLTPYLKFGGAKNVVSVRLEVDQPGCRWYSGAGLYRHVYLISNAPVHVAMWGVYITTPKAASDGSEVRVQSTVRNDGAAPKDVKLITILLDPNGKEVTRQDATKTVAGGSSAIFDQNLNLTTASLWSTDTPVLYHAVNELNVDGTLTDSVSTPFGIRSFEFTKDKGFFLNGRHVQIQGVCDHHDLGCLGTAAYRRALERQLQILKGFGCNALRTSHNPPSPELLDLCDQMGFLVMDEAFDEWQKNHNKYGYAVNFNQWSEPDLRSMIDRDRNHPSIILYSIGNEIIEGRTGLPIAGPAAERLAAICHREDPTRPVTSACPVPQKDWDSGLAKALDVFGINYSIGWYGKNDPKIPATAKPDDTGYHGQLPMVASETCSQVDSRDEYGLKLGPNGQVQIDPKPNFQVSSYDTWHTGWACSAETDLLALKNSPWVAGEYVWSGFDYIGEPTPYGWPSRSSYFGIVDLAGFPKDRYYIYKSVWDPEPLVHIRPMSWTWPGFEGKTIPVQVFTNADSVELFLNGVSLGVRNFPADCAEQVTTSQNKDKTQPDKITTSPGLHLAWNVVYAPGALRAVARKNGRVVATDEIKTAGDPARIMLEPDRAQITADGQDLSFIKVALIDKDGTLCPNANGEIHFTLRGTGATIAGLDNGDATNHEPFQGSQHKAFHGLALVVLKSQPDSPGAVTLTATAPGLPPASTTVTSIAAP